MILEYQIQTTGLDRFIAQQRTIEQILERNARQDVARDQRVGSQRVRISDTTVAKKVAGGARGAAAEQREETRLLKWRENVRNRHFQQLDRDQRRHEAKQLQAQARVEAQKTRAEQQAHAKRLAAQERADALALRQATRTTTREAALRRRTAERVGRGIATGAGNAASFGMSALRGAAGLAAVGGTFAVGSAVANRLGLDASLRQVANAGYVQGGPKTREQLYAETKAQVDSIAGRGSDASAIASAMQAILAKTGNYEVASKGISGVERLAVATGTDPEAMASTFGSAIESIMRANPNMSSDAAVQQGLALTRTFAGHGKFGSVEVSDVASQGAKLIGSASRFGGDRSANIADMSTLVQQAIKGGATSAEDAATAVKNLPNDLMKSQKRAGLSRSDLYDKSGQFRRIEEILPKLFEKTKGDQTKLFGEGNVFGNQSMAAVLPLLEEWKRAGGGKRGAAAIKGVFDSFRGQTMSEREVGESYDFANQGGDRQFAAARNDFNRQVGDKLLPELTKLIPKIAELTPQVVRLTEAAIQAGKWLAENPFQGAALVVGGFLVKELAAAAIGATIKSVIAQALAGWSAAGAVGTATTAAAGSAATTAATTAGAGAAGAAASKPSLIARAAGGLRTAGGVLATAVGAAGAGAIVASGAGELAIHKMAKERGAYSQEGGAKVGIGGDFQGIAGGMAGSGPGQGVNIVAAVKALFGAAEEQRKATQNLRDATSNIQSAAGPSPRSDPILKR